MRLVSIWSVVSFQLFYVYLLGSWYWFRCAGFIFTTLLLIGAIRRNIAFCFLLGFLSLTFLLLAIAEFSGKVRSSSPFLTCGVYLTNDDFIRLRSQKLEAHSASSPHSLPTTVPCRSCSSRRRATSRCLWASSRSELIRRARAHVHITHDVDGRFLYVCQGEKGGGWYDVIVISHFSIPICAVWLIGPTTYILYFCALFWVHSRSVFLSSLLPRTCILLYQILSFRFLRI